MKEMPSVIIIAKNSSGCPPRKALPSHPVSNPLYHQIFLSPSHVFFSPQHQSLFNISIVYVCLPLECTFYSSVLFIVVSSESTTMPGINLNKVLLHEEYEAINIGRDKITFLLVDDNIVYLESPR